MDTAVICEVRPGLRESERTVAVVNIHGRKEFLRIEGSYLRCEGGKFYLPVGYIYEHPESDSVLIELPMEADSGARRVFVPRKNIQVRNKVPA
jgi:hypothetical protein